MTDPAKEEFDPHAALDVLRKYCLYSDDVVDMFDNRDELIKALNQLSTIERWMIVRWSDPNYG